MNLEVYTALENEIEYTKKLIEELKNKKSTVLILPETFCDHYKPKELSKYIRKKVNEHIKYNTDLTIFTYSKIVFDSVRVVVKENNYEGLKVYFKTKERELLGIVLPNGRMDNWPDGFFDTEENLLIELL